VSNDTSADNGYANDADDIPAAWTDHLPREDFPDRIHYDNEIVRIRALLDRSHSYMRNAHLLPPRDEFVSVDWYVQVLRMFERAPAAKLKIYRFLPTPEQRRANGEELMEWDAAQRRSRSLPTDDGRSKRALGLLDWRCFTAEGIRKRDGSRVPALAKVPEGIRDVETRDAMRYLAPLVNDGHLTRGELHDAIIDASLQNRHIPDNKSQRFVERQIDHAITKFSTFDWDRLDDDC
jgi:hypothetical protein